MRKDIGKVICERERVGGYGNPGKGKNRKGYHKELERVNYRTYHSLADVNTAEYDCWIDGVGYAAPFYAQRDEPPEELARHGVPYDDDWRPELFEQPPSDFDKPAVRRRESIKNMKGGTKEFTDVLGALRGWVRNQIGRPWAKASAEMDAVLPATGGMSFRHARGHLFDFIETKIVVDDDGKLCHSEGYRRFRPIEESYGGFGPVAYVDPRDGIVKAIKPRKRHRRGVSVHRLRPDHWDGKRAFYAQKNGVWYRYELEPLVPIRTYTVQKDIHAGTTFKPYVMFKEIMEMPPVYDVYLECATRHEYYASDAHERQRIYGGEFYAASKRQLNAREIKAAGVREKLPTKPQPTSNKRKKRQQRRNRG